MDTTSTRERILEAATAVFVESGYDGARMDEVARRAGVNKAAIYYHIGGKEALYGEVLKRVFAPVADQVESVLASGRPSAEKLRAHIERVARNLDRHPELPRIMMWEIASAGGKQLPGVARDELTRIVEVTARIVEEGQLQGVFREVNPVLVHMLIIGPMLLWKAAEPLRRDYLPPELSGLGPELMDRTASVLSELVVSALRDNTDRAGEKG